MLRALWTDGTGQTGADSCECVYMGRGEGQRECGRGRGLGALVCGMAVSERIGERARRGQVETGCAR